MKLKPIWKKRLWNAWSNGSDFINMIVIWFALGIAVVRYYKDPEFAELVVLGFIALAITLCSCITLALRAHDVRRERLAKIEAEIKQEQSQDSSPSKYLEVCEQSN